jgi:membrane fusion protein (multidrug efflux system)
MKTIPNMKTIIVLFFAAAISTSFYSCSMKSSGETPQNAEASEQKARPVKVMELAYHETAVEQNITSTILAFEETYLSPALQGRIRSIKVDVDDHVAKGDLLVEMDRTQLDQTMLQYETLKTDLARMDTLLQYGSITQQAFDQMKSQVETTELVLRNLEENTLLRAPHAGIITGKYYNDGELFSPTPNTPAGKSALISLVQMDPVKLMVNLSETYIPLVKEGMEATITTDVYPGRTFNGRVFRIHPTVNPATRTFTMEVKVPNPQEILHPWMFAVVSLKFGAKQALIVPSIAVLQQTGTNERYIMLSENGKARKVTVKILNRYDDKLEIGSGEISGGEQLIYAGQSSLEDGAPVSVEME